MTAHDFFKINKAYYQTLLEKNMIQQVLEGREDSIDWERDVVEKALEDNAMAESMVYQNRLMELLENVEEE